MSHRSPKRAVKEIIRTEAEKHAGRPMTNKAAKGWLKKQAKAPKLVEYRPFRWPRVHTLPTMYAGMAAMVHKHNTVPFGWGQLHQPGMSEAIQMPMWFWWGLNAFEFIRSAPTRFLLWITGFRRKK